jgi:hypothetical protein
MNDRTDIGVTCWNRVFDQTGIDFRITLPYVASNRGIGEFATIHTNPEGHVNASPGLGAAQGNHASIPVDIC